MNVSIGTASYSVEQKSDFLKSFKKFRQVSIVFSIVIEKGMAISISMVCNADYSNYVAEMKKIFLPIFDEKLINNPKDTNIAIRYRNQY